MLDARTRVMLELNVGQADLEAVLDVLPCMRQPTISALRGETCVSCGRTEIYADRPDRLFPESR